VYKDTIKPNINPCLKTQEKCEAIKRAVSGYKKITSIFSKVIGTKNKATECSYKIAQCVASKGKPFTDGEFVKETFLSSAEILFIDLPNKETILSRIREIPASVRSIERHITEMAENVTVIQTTGLQQAVGFSVALDKTVDVNEVEHLVTVARYCDDRIYEELCCLIRLGATAKGEDITAFVSYFENQKININKIVCVTTDASPAMFGKNKGFVKLL
jgi:CDGSH-type Zn-finger protein